MSRAWDMGLRRRRRPALMVLLLVGVASLGSPMATAVTRDSATPVVDGAGPIDGDRLVVRLDGPATAADQSALAKSVGGARVSEVRPGVFTVEVAKGKRAEALKRLEAARDVAGAEPDVRFHAAGIPPNEPCFAGCELSFGNGAPPQTFSQDELIRMGAIDAWNVTLGNPDILVAVIDTDVDATHPDLVGKVIVGRDFSGDPNPDPSGHATAVAGIIAAQPDNGMGIAGLGWSTRVLSVRVLDSHGAGLATDIAKGIRYAADYSDGTAKVRVINLSLQQDADDADQVSSELSDAIEYAQSQGVLVVAAAGNQSRTAPSYPATFPGVLGVTAVDDNDGTASFSNRGEWVDLAAPGVGVLTLAAGCNCWSVPDGTSFAAPYVSAAAALVMAAHPELTAEQVSAQLRATADQVGNVGTDFTAGRLNVGKAVTGPVVQLPGTDPTDPDPTDPGAGLIPGGADDDPIIVGPPGGSGPAPTSLEPEPSPRQDLANPLNAGPAATGYWLAASDGGIFNFGSTKFHGSTGSLRLNTPMVGIAGTPTGRGYWLVASDGGIFTFGDANFYGSTGTLKLNRPIVGMASTPSGKGYWLVASDGGIFTFGDANFYGSTGALSLNKPIVAMTPTPSGRGYWLAASDGGIFTFGDAGFFGSTGALRLAKPIVGAASTPTGRGYWLVAADGGLFNFGDAAFSGSAAGRTKADVVGIAASGTGAGYWIVAADGSVLNFGGAPALGNLAQSPLNRPIVGLAIR